MSHNSKDDGDTGQVWIKGVETGVLDVRAASYPGHVRTLWLTSFFSPTTDGSRRAKARRERWGRILIVVGLSFSPIPISYCMFYPVDKCRPSLRQSFVQATR